MGLYGLCKGVVGLGMCAYLSFIVYLIALPDDGARHFWRDNWNPKYGVPLKSRLDTTFYLPDACELTFFAVKELLWTEPYGLCHLIGWFAKGLLLREFWVAWILSGSFEIVELTFRHWIPSFTECWWDHVFCDFLLTNLLGIFCAVKLCDLVGLRRYNWLGPDKHRGLWYYALPEPSRFLYTVLLCFMFTWMDANTFLLKAAMWVPVLDTINLYRMVAWFFFGIFATADFYDYVESNRNIFSIGIVPVLAAVILLCEFTLCMKLDYPQAFTKPFPEWVAYHWSIWGPSAFLYSCIILGQVFFKKPAGKHHHKKAKKNQ